MTRAGRVFKIVSDLNGSPRIVLDVQTGEIVQSIGYDTFGNITNDAQVEFQPFAFSGGLYDASTRMTRLGARDYDSVIGRWTSEDPLGFAGRSANLYVYANNDPVNFFDPTGSIVTALVGGVLGAVSAGVAARSAGLHGIPLIQSIVVGGGAGTLAGITSLATVPAVVLSGGLAATSNFINQKIKANAKGCEARIDGRSIAFSAIAGAAGTALARLQFSNHGADEISEFGQALFGGLYATSLDLFLQFANYIDRISTHAPAGRRTQ